MALMKTISGIRGTIGGTSGDNLTPIDIVECVAGFGMWLKSKQAPLKVVVGKDGRMSGNMVSNLAIQTLIGMGIDVVDLGFSTTPTVELYVPKVNAGAGIIFTASHNPKQWNALKFLNAQGEFISAADGEQLLAYIANKNLVFAEVDHLGKLSHASDAIDYHIKAIMVMPRVNLEAIAKADFHFVVDCINSTGVLSVPPLLDRLGVRYTLINETLTGDFAHNPEPLAEHLIELSTLVKETKADGGISIDPDVDRLAFVCEDGSMFGEEYTLVAVADYILGKEGGNAVSNLSSTRALADVTKKHGGTYTAAAVGEVNVVTQMKKSQAAIGGEGNGGIIVPDFHYGRDALVGIALFLSYVAERQLPLTAVRDALPKYVILKDKFDVAGVDLEAMFLKLKETFAQESINEVDGLKIDFANGWVHMRKSNTEPIVRVYAEAATEAEALSLITRVKQTIF